MAVVKFLQSRRVTWITTGLKITLLCLLVVIQLLAGYTKKCNCHLFAGDLLISLTDENLEDIMQIINE